MKRVYQQMKEFLTSIEKDKHLHFELSYIIAYFIAWICKAFGLSQGEAELLGAGCAFTIGLIKEFVMDYIINGESVDADDVAADLAGSILGAIMSV